MIENYVGLEVMLRCNEPMGWRFGFDEVQLMLFNERNMVKSAALLYSVNKST
jgi:hypothetical protein